MKKVSLSALSLLFAIGCTEPPAVLDKGVPITGPSREDQVADQLEAVRGSPEELRAFLKAMPKGGDLHSHISGAVSTESLIQWGAEDGVCVDTKTFAAVSPPCGPGTELISDAIADLEKKTNILRAWSLESYNGPLLGRHKHFFDTFGLFGAAFGADRFDDAVAEAMSTAAKNGQIYIELISGLSSGAIGDIAADYIKDGDTWDEAYLLSKRDEITADPVFSQTINTVKADIPSWIDGARQILGCGTASEDPGCGVEVRFLMSADRTKSKGYVFAQWVYGYELVQAAPEVVGINLASPEENANSLANYDDEMTAVDVLRRFNEGDTSRRPVHISLHAGELIQEVLPQSTEGLKHLTYHIRRAVDMAHAERIGHGVDLAMESDGEGTLQLLDEMRQQHVMVEICLESNNALLGTYGIRHPLHTYLVHGVPVALASDDQGVLRTSITDDYIRAVDVQGLDYRRLKSMVRTSLEHSFLGGESIWAPDSFYTIAPDCQYDKPTAKPEELSPGCSAFLAASEKATMQWKLEAGFEVFEDSMVTSTSP